MPFKQQRELDIEWINSGVFWSYEEYSLIAYSLNKIK